MSALLSDTWKVKWKQAGHWCDGKYTPIWGVKIVDEGGHEMLSTTCSGFDPENQPETLRAQHAADLHNRAVEEFMAEGYREMAAETMSDRFSSGTA